MTLEWGGGGSEPGHSQRKGSRQRKLTQMPEWKWPMQLENSRWEAEGSEELRALAGTGCTEPCRLSEALSTSLLNLYLSAPAWKRATMGSLWCTISLYFAHIPANLCWAQLDSIKWQVGCMSAPSVSPPLWATGLDRTCSRSDGRVRRPSGNTEKLQRPVLITEALSLLHTSLHLCPFAQSKHTTKPESRRGAACYASSERDCKVTWKRERWRTGTNNSVRQRF